MARKTAVSNDSEQIKDQVFSELQALIEESEKLLTESVSLVGEEADTLRAQLGLKLRQARDATGRLGQRAQPVVDATQEYIGGHPWQTVAISAGFGLVVGLLLGRRQ
ncbi:DUF883 family protein [Pseudomonas entomophila]|uniref:DUF883 family protein n=1 Tax=Pseudomonas entomophila TaxID=312306 RepID=UPI001F00DCFC|nr:DUF883 family protein [Pseudomonas entomophila]MCG8295577.1 DUF883 family protein [Pseudomonas entomophila]